MPTYPLSGAHFALAGFKLIAKRELRHFVLIPLLLNLMLFTLLFWISSHYFSVLSHWASSYLPHWLHWLESIFWFFFLTVFFLVVSYTFVTLANLVGAPFNSLLARQVEEYLTDTKHPDEPLIMTLKDFPRVLGRQLAILGYYLPRALLLLCLFVIPGLQIIAAPLLFIFNGWFMALQVIDYPTDNHRLPFTTVKQQLNKRYFLVFSFGLCILLLAMIPIVNLLIVPAAIAGGTKLWLEELQ